MIPSLEFLARDARTYYLQELGLEMKSPGDRTPISELALGQDINEGFLASTRNYITSRWSTRRDDGATSIKLEIDPGCTKLFLDKNCSRCIMNNQHYADPCQDITKNSLIHCDCRYLSLETSTNLSLPRITQIIFLRGHDEADNWIRKFGNRSCTEDINNERGNNTIDPLYLCWKTEPGKNIN